MKGTRVSAILIFALLCSFHGLRTAPLGACDDTLMALLTSANPKSEFSRGVRQFNREVTALGSALRENRASEIEPLLAKVMETWLGLSNRFSVNPPDEARNDENWAKKMQGVAERIGLIRKLIKEGGLMVAHDNLQELSNHLGTFFESVRMSESYKVFLRMSEHFFQHQAYAASGTVSGLSLEVASLSSFLKDLEPRIASDTRECFQTSKMSLASLERYLAGRPDLGSETVALVKNAEEDFLALRSRILMLEWFPMAPPQIASQGGKP